MNMYLRPSEIRFSRDSIGCIFRSCYFSPIGETLDDILTGTIDVNSIPCISVCKRNGYWFTTDNKRLWVFQQAEKRGKCSKIYVRSTSCIDGRKFTTKNDGLNVRVRGDPGGSIWRRMSFTNSNSEETAVKTLASIYTRPPSIANGIVHQHRNNDHAGIRCTNHENNAEITNRCLMSYLVLDKPDLEQGIAEMSIDSGSQLSIQNDSDSEMSIDSGSQFSIQNDSDSDWNAV